MYDEVKNKVRKKKLLPNQTKLKTIGKKSYGHIKTRTKPDVES